MGVKYDLKAVPVQADPSVHAVSHGIRHRSACKTKPMRKMALLIMGLDNNESKSLHVCLNLMFLLCYLSQINLFSPPHFSAIPCKSSRRGRTTWGSGSSFVQLSAQYLTGLKAFKTFEISRCFYRLWWVLR